MFKYRVDHEIDLALLEAGHAEKLFQLISRSRDTLRQWLYFTDKIISIEDARSFIESSLFNYEANDGFSAGIWYQDELAGTIGFHRMDTVNRKVEMGYWLSKDFEGRGVMTRSCKAMMQYAFVALNVNRVELRVGVDNIKSRAIPERLGFQLEGILRQAEWVNGHFIDNAIYGMLIEDWIKLARTV
ncbi:MAG TPA: GNAT family N-acetyltransferase [Bacilli bacterium]